MTEKELDKFRKKTIKICVFSILIGVLVCIVPCIILAGIIRHFAENAAAVPGSYPAIGIISAAVIAAIAVFCVRTVTAALRKYREEKR